MQESSQQPGSPFWRERYGQRTMAQYFEDYFQRTRNCGADGVFFHSLCRLEALPVEMQAEIATALRRVFGQLDKW